MTEPGLHQTAVFDNPSAEEGSLVQSVGVEEMARALCAYTIRTRRKWDTPSDKIEAMIAKGDVVDFAWRDYVGEAEVAVALFAPILAEKEAAIERLMAVEQADLLPITHSVFALPPNVRPFKWAKLVSKMRARIEAAEARALAAEAALAGLRQNILDADVICDDDEKAEARLSRLAAAIRAQE